MLYFPVSFFSSALLNLTPALEQNQKPAPFLLQPRLIFTIYCLAPAAAGPLTQWSAVRLFVDEKLHERSVLDILLRRQLFIVSPLAQRLRCWSSLSCWAKLNLLLSHSILP